MVGVAVEFGFAEGEGVEVVDLGAELFGEFAGDVVAGVDARVQAVAGGVGVGGGGEGDDDPGVGDFLADRLERLAVAFPVLLLAVAEAVQAVVEVDEVVGVAVEHGGELIEEHGVADAGGGGHVGDVGLALQVLVDAAGVAVGDGVADEEDAWELRAGGFGDPHAAPLGAFPFDLHGGLVFLRRPRRRWPARRIGSGRRRRFSWDVSPLAFGSCRLVDAEVAHKRVRRRTR